MRDIPREDGSSKGRKKSTLTLKMASWGRVRFPGRFFCVCSSLISFLPCLFLVTTLHDVRQSLVISSTVSRIQVCLPFCFPFLHLPPWKQTRMLPSSRIPLLAMPPLDFSHVHLPYSQRDSSVKLRINTLLCRVISWSSRRGPC